jgi:hypothetical protein
MAGVDAAWKKTHQKAAPLVVSTKASALTAGRRAQPPSRIAR